MSKLHWASVASETVGKTSWSRKIEKLITPSGKKFAESPLVTFIAPLIGSAAHGADTRLSFNQPEIIY